MSAYHRIALCFVGIATHALSAGAIEPMVGLTDPRTVYAVPSVPLPAYLFTEKLPPFGTAITRVTGDVGTPIAPGDETAKGPGGGDQPGQHILEVDLTIAELAQILGEELALPLIKPKDRSSILIDHEKYRSYHRDAAQ